jgi:Glycosyl hydrolases family 35
LTCAGWVLSETPGDLRSDNKEYHEAWVPYIAAVSAIIRRNQITEGGPIILVQAENEYTSRNDEGPPRKREMMAQVRKAFIDGGVTVPQTHNDMGMWWNYVSGTGSPDIYGFDDYPVSPTLPVENTSTEPPSQQGFDCSHPYEWHNITHAYHEYHMKAFPKSPLYIPEAQAGAFDPWGPSAP